MISMSDNEKLSSVLSKIPEAQRPAASALLTQYGPRLLSMAHEDIWQYIRRLLAGDLLAAAELDDLLTDDEFLAAVKANTAQWEAVAEYNIARAKMRFDFAVKVAPVLLTILLALVGL